MLERRFAGPGSPEKEKIEGIGRSARRSDRQGYFAWSFDLRATLRFPKGRVQSGSIDYRRAIGRFSRQYRFGTSNGGRPDGHDP